MVREMPLQFVSEPLKPVGESFDTAGMSMGEPGIPHRFIWRKAEYELAEVLERWKEHGDCTHGSGERYVRKHGYRIRTTSGLVLRIYFQRSFGKSRSRGPRWWVHSMEESGD